MEASEWVALIIAAVTIANGWFEFWVKEQFFGHPEDGRDAVLSFFRSKLGIGVIASSGIAAVGAGLTLAFVVASPEPVTRFSCLVIAGLVMLCFMNMALVYSLYLLRRMAKLARRIRQTADEAKLRSWMGI